jgi:hypothetical protein
MGCDFHLGDILSVTTERLVSPDHIDGVYRILNYMTGDNLFTHQLPRANHECAPALLAQHPQLNAVEVPDDFGPDPEAAVTAWLAEQVARYGETLPVEPLAAADHTRIDPVDELAMLKGGDRSGIIVVRLDEDRDERP